MPLLDPRIKLRHLSAFLETVREDGVVGAGEALGLTQPAISKAISELEAILGASLFERTGRKLVLSATGEIFLRYANAAVSALRQGVDMLAEAGPHQGTVRFGALPSVEAEVVPRAVALFAAGPMASRVQVESGPSPYLIGLLRSGAIDFVVGRMPQPEAMTGLVFEHLYSEELVFAVRPAHPLASQPSLPLRAIEPFAVLIPPKGAIIRPTLDALLMAASVGRLRHEVETVSNSFGRAYALASDAVWIISRSVVAADLAHGQLAALPFDMSMSQGPVGILTRAGAEHGMPASALMDAVRAAALNALR